MMSPDDEDLKDTLVSSKKSDLDIKTPDYHNSEDNVTGHSQDRAHEDEVIQPKTEVKLCSM